VDIYIYPNAAEMKATLDLSGVNWVAGHADPDLGVMAVALPAGPEQRLLMDQRIPHELMHILTYQSMGQTYANLPVWLSEGLASIAELYPNPDYQVLLNNAQKKDSLLAMSSLCQAFPRDASSALLAYAQSASFTRYLYNKFGISGFQALLDRYADGLDCGRAVESALRHSLVQLERQWRQETFAENVSLKALNNLLPWFVLLLAALAAPLSLTLGRLRRREISPVGD
jgi:hypothetical protein